MNPKVKGAEFPISSLGGGAREGDTKRNVSPV